VTLGPGDDAAVVASDDGRTVVSPTCWCRTAFPAGLVDAARRRPQAIAQNAADIEAMGLGPRHSWSVSARPAITPAAAAGRAGGRNVDEAGRIGAGIAGGDLVSCPQWVVFGDGPRRAARPRAGIAIGGEPVRYLPWPGSWAAQLRI